MVSTDLGLAFELDNGDGDEEGLEEEDSDDTPSKGMHVATGSRFLMFRVQLFDRLQAQKNDFVPSVIGAVLSGVVHKSSPVKGQTESKDEFDIPRGAFLKIIRRLERSTASGQEIVSKITGAAISGTVETVSFKPLADFDIEESVASFVDGLVALQSQK